MTQYIATGDKVIIERKNGGEQTVIVAMVMDEAPALPPGVHAKPILGRKVEDEKERLDPVDKWHETDQSQPLHEFLGMTWEEYSAWVAAGHKSGFDEASDGRELPA